jgi:hypothetical protein
LNDLLYFRACRYREKFADARWLRTAMNAGLVPEKQKFPDGSANHNKAAVNVEVSGSCKSATQFLHGPVVVTTAPSHFFTFFAGQPSTCQ